MNLEKLFEILLSNPDSVNIQYTNNNGKEKLVVNGKDLTIDRFDDTATKELIAKYKDIVKKLDDCDFLEIVEEIGEQLDVQTFDELLDQESFTEEDASIVESMIEFVKSVIHNHLVNKIANLQEILENL